MKNAAKTANAIKDRLEKEVSNRMVSENAEMLKRLIAEKFDSMDFDGQGMGGDEGAEMAQDGNADDLEAALAELKTMAESGHGEGMEGHEQEEEEESYEQDDEDIFAEEESDMLSDEDIDKMLGEMEEIEEAQGADTLEKEVDEIIQKIKAKSSQGMEEDYSKMQDDFTKEMGKIEGLESDLEDDIMAEIKKAYEAEMTENSSITYQNEKGMNKKPEGYEYKDDKYKTMYESVAKRLKKSLQENRELKAKLDESNGKGKKLYEAAQKLALFNENLTNIVKIFNENALTERQKNAILESYFDKEPKTIEESKQRATKIQEGLQKMNSKPSEKPKLPIQEAKKQEASESKAYINESLEKMHRLINYTGQKK